MHRAAAVHRLVLCAGELSMPGENKHKRCPQLRSCRCDPTRPTPYVLHILPCITASRSSAFTRVCQPCPLDLRASRTSASRRMVTAALGFAMRGRPIGRIAFNCTSVRGCASRSDKAADVMAASSAWLGRMMMRPDRVLTVCCIVHYLSIVRLSQADDAPHIGTINERHKINPFANQPEGALAGLAVTVAAVGPYQSAVPLQL